MTQTELTIPDMNTALQDNVANAISPSDLRNVMATALGGYAGLSVVGDQYGIECYSGTGIGTNSSGPPIAIPRNCLRARNNA